MKIRHAYDHMPASVCVICGQAQRHEWLTDTDGGTWCLRCAEMVTGARVASGGMNRAERRRQRFG